MTGKFARRLGEIVLIILLSIALGEVTLRIYNHYNPSFILYDSSYNRFRGKPGAPDYDFNLNSRGFKDVEFKSEKESGVYRIVALGDSFAFGVVPYRQNYLTLLEQQLNSSNSRIEVLNMGIPSIGPQDYLAMLANEGLELQPDMVLVSFFIGNDITETIHPVPSRLYEYSAVAALIRYLIVLNQSYEGRVFHGRTGYDDTAPTFSEEAFLDIEKNRALIHLKREPFKKAFADAMDYLVRIKALCDAKKIALVVVLLPDEVQVNRSLQARVIGALNVTPDELDFALPNKLLHEQLGLHDIEHFDLLDGFLSASAHTTLYKPNDTHWNIAGNKLAADILTGYMSGRLSK